VAAISECVAPFLVRRVGADLLSVQDKDQGYKALLVRAQDLKRSQIAVGITEAVGSKQHGKDGLTTILDIATFHEFGTGTIPERSFLRAWFDENEEQAKVWVERVTKLIFQGKLTQARGLALLGLKFVGEIQERMALGIPPPLALETVWRKGSSTPLIDTGQLRSSITYVVGEGHE